jgi:hypothetical protein
VSRRSPRSCWVVGPEVGSSAPYSEWSGEQLPAATLAWQLCEMK